MTAQVLSLLDELNLYLHSPLRAAAIAGLCFGATFVVRFVLDRRKG